MAGDGGRESRTGQGGDPREGFSSGVYRLMAATAQSGKRTDDLVSGTPFDLGSTNTGTGRTRVPEILLGTFLVAVFALAGAWFYSSSTQSTSYVTLLADVQRGEEIVAENLTRIEVSGDDTLQAVRWSDAGTIVGRLAITDLSRGSLVTPGLFTDQADIAPGFGIVGLALGAAEYPTTGIRPGDWVRVVAVPGSGAGDENQPATVLADRVQIVEVVTTGGSERFVSLTMETATADVVAAVEADGRVRLIQIPDTTSASVDEAADEDGSADGAAGASDPAEADDQ